MDQEIREWMEAHVSDYIDPERNEVNLTMLAEDCAMALGHEEWLEDADEEVWQIAIEVATSLDGVDVTW